MARRQQREDDDAVVAAIERVLRVERDGVERLRHGQAHAAQLIDRTRVQAAAIATRADARIARLYGNYLQKVECDIAELTQSSWSASEQLEGVYEGVSLDQAVRRVAVKLTGGVYIVGEFVGQNAPVANS